MSKRLRRTPNRDYAMKLRRDAYAGLDNAISKALVAIDFVTTISSLCMEAVPYAKRELKHRAFPRKPMLKVGELYYYQPSTLEWDIADMRSPIEVVEFKGMHPNSIDAIHRPVYKRAKLEEGSCVLFLGYVKPRCQGDVLVGQVEVLHKEKIFVLGFPANVFSSRYKMADDVLIPVVRKT